MRVIETRSRRRQNENPATGWHNQGASDMPTYFIAVYEGFNQDTIHIIEHFEAADDAAANAYAKANHSDIDWYVLDANRQNINA